MNSKLLLTSCFIVLLIGCEGKTSHNILEKPITEQMKQEKQNKQQEQAIVTTTEKVEVTKPTVPTNIKATHIIAKNSPYYTNSPAQASPADGNLTKGTKVQLISASGSYILVEASTGVRGYVAISSLAQL